MSGGEIVRHEVAQCHATARQGGVLAQVNDEDIQTFTARVGVCAEAGEVVHEVLKRGFFQRPALLFGFIEVVEKVANEMRKSVIIESLCERVADERDGLGAIHAYLATRYSERMTSRGLKLCRTRSARVV